MVAAPFEVGSGVDRVIAAWQAQGRIRRCFAAERALGAHPARFAPLPEGLGPGARRALAQRGIHSLYSHQAEAIEAALRGRHLVVATPTASGKSLCFHLPVLETLSRDPTATALFLYPTKALSRDQEQSLRRLLADAELPLPAMVYDGDTPGDARRATRERCRIVLTNPDMLHSGILPSHPRFASLFRGLSHVVVDELHTYRGVFGSHVAHVLARLKRVAALHGARPTLIGATATIGNPAEHAARLFGVPREEVTLVDRSGAPSSPREVYVYNPPVIHPDLGVRQSTLKHAVSLAADLVRARVPTILFAPSRNSVEVMLKYLRAEAGEVAGPEAIMGYRGGYLPDTRRRIEAGLREGSILCVVATNALELGIDIGDLDAVLCAGYPGSIAGTWQRFGRAGRRAKKSVAVLLCSSSAIDQYLAREPDYLFSTAAEEARIEPENLEILIQHLRCAAFEAPFRLTPAGPRLGAPEPAQGEPHFGLDAASTRDALHYLAQHGLIHESGGVHHYIGESFPASHVSLRNVGWDNTVIVDVESEKTIGELDFRATLSMLHEQAIYQQNAEQYQVERLDLENHKAFVRKVEPDYFTTALTSRKVTVLGTAETGAIGAARTGHGDVRILEKVTGYKKIKFFTHENAGYGDVHLPELELHTLSFWLTVGEAGIATLGEPRPLAVDGLRGVGHALKTVAALSLMCDPRDIGSSLQDQSAFDDPESQTPGRLDPTLFLFDAHPGGVGLAPRIHERRVEFLTRARALVRGCPCQDGCPACVGPTEPGFPRKRVGLGLFQLLGAVTAG